ncbi:MAG: biotin--[acetyl-CoA-carboxylase] ligase [Candidatus Firestonebacteria bacterium]
MEEEILKIIKLYKNEHVSGEELSKKFKISRTAIWKHIHSLINQGYNIEPHPHLGYKFISSPDKLLPAEIKEDLNTKYIGKDLYCFNEIGSTNDFALRLAGGKVKEGTVIISEKQTYGKGRLGRSWLSPSCLGLYFSIILKPRISPHHASKITFLGGLSVIEAIKETTGLDTKLKWPNDVLYNGKKLCGILTEIKAELDIVNYLVIGLGVNVNFLKKDFPFNIRSTATSLKIELGRDILRLNLLKVILQNIENYYEMFKKEGFKPILENWKGKSVTLNKRVKVATEGDIIEGYAIDVDDECALLIRLDNGMIRKVVSGNVF